MRFDFPKVKFGLYQLVIRKRTAQINKQKYQN